MAGSMLSKSRPGYARNAWMPTRIAGSHSWKRNTSSLVPLSSIRCQQEHSASMSITAPNPGGSRRSGSCMSLLPSPGATAARQLRGMRPVSPCETSGCWTSRSSDDMLAARERWLRASPPLRPASRASSDVNSCAWPLACAARPPALAICRCWSASIPANPRPRPALFWLPWFWLRLGTAYSCSAELQRGSATSTSSPARRVGAGAAATFVPTHRSPANVRLACPPRELACVPALTLRGQRRNYFPRVEKTSPTGACSCVAGSSFDRVPVQPPLARELRLHFRLQPEEDNTVQDDNPAASAARELKAAAREALRMGSLWTHHAIQWVDERRNEMNNRNREQEQRERERSERNRYSTSGYGSDEGDYGPGQYGRQNEQSGLSGARRGSQARDRDVQGDYSSGDWLHGRGSQPGYGREGGDLHAQDDSGLRGDYGSHAQHGSGRPQYGQDSQRSGAQQRGSRRYASQGAEQSRYDIQGSRYGSQGYGAQGYGAGSESFESQDFSQDYSQGSSHYGSQGFGAQGSQGVYGPQGFGSQGSRSSSDYERQSAYGGYSFGGHGGL